MMMGFGFLFFLLLVAAVAYAGGWRPQYGQPLQPGTPAGGSGGGNALQILRERYARGEISADDYARMYEVLKD